MKNLLLNSDGFNFFTEKQNRLPIILNSSDDNNDIELCLYDSISDVLGIESENEINIEKYFEKNGFIFFNDEYIIKDDELYIFDNELFITNVEFENREMIYSVCDIDGDTILSANYIYKIKSNVFETTLYLAEYESGTLELSLFEDEIIYSFLAAFDDFSIYHFGDTELKKYCNLDKNVVEILLNGDDIYKIVNKINLNEQNTMYYSSYVGVDEEGFIIFYSYIHCNIKTNDIPQIDLNRNCEPLIFKNIDELKKDEIWKNCDCKEDILKLLKGI